jgi:hypothetical protein
MDKWQFEEVYRRVEQFSLDDPDAVLPFSKKLARENGWTAQYTQRVIIEYKKFMVLAVVAGHPVTPSEQVDQVWHLHLTYTHSYWNKFCAETLQKSLHHCPTLGGISEYEKFYQWYSETLISYEKFFNQPPPPDIWAPPAIRINQGKGFMRINTQAYWLIPKPSFQFLNLTLSLPRSPLVRLSAIALLFLLVTLNFHPITSLITSANAYPNPTFDVRLTATQMTEITSEASDSSAYQDLLAKILVVLSGLLFLIGITQFAYYKALINRPVFIAPVGGSNFQSKHSSHDKEVVVVHFLMSSTFAYSCMALFTTLLLFWSFDLLAFLGLIYSIVFLINSVYHYIYFIWRKLREKPIEEFPSISTYSISSKYHIQLLRERGSIRPLHCKICKQPLREISQGVSLENFGLSKPQNVNFQMWHCSQCHPEINRETVHLYILRGTYPTAKNLPPEAFDSHVDSHVDSHTSCSCGVCSI